MGDARDAASATIDDLLPLHPLQRLQSPSHSISAFVHLVGLASFTVSFRWLLTNPNPANDSYGWHFQYLTIIGLLLSTITFLAGLAADLTLSRRLFLAKNLLSVCSAPLECIVSFLYWGLRAIDPKLVVRPDVELPIIPDLGFHAIPAALLVVDLLLLSPPWAITALPAIGLSGGIAFAYWFWIELCYSHNGWYPYPIFAMLETTQRIGLFSTSALLMAASTAALKWLYGRINGYSVYQRPQARPGHVKAE